MSFVGPLFRNPEFQSTVQLRQSFSKLKTVIAWWSMFACSATALMTSCYLAWASLTSSAVAGCDGGSVFDCSHVLHSRWSNVMSIPVSIPAMAIHMTVLAMLMVKPVSARMDQARWAIIGFAALSAGAAAVWFVGLQVFWIEHLCLYCLIAHTCGVVLAAVFLWNRPQMQSFGWVVAAATAAITGLILLQTLSIGPQTFELIDHSKKSESPGAMEDEDASIFEAPKSAAEPQASWMRNPLELRVSQVSSYVALLLNPAILTTCEIANEADDGQVKSARILNNLKLETNVWPLLGKPDAELVFVELFDYTCEHCQRTHKAIEGARAKLGDRLAIIALPVPLDIKCNPSVKATDAAHAESCAIAKLAVAVWSVDHDKYAEFHHYLFTAKPTYAVALIKANETVDSEKLKAMLSSNLPSEYIAKHVAIYQKAGGGTIPKLMFPKTTSVGAIESTDVLVQLIEQHLR